MSIAAMNWALRIVLPPRTSSAKALLVVLSYRSRMTSLKRFECYPSSQYLAHATGQNRKTLQRNLGKLQRWGLLSDTGRRMGKTRQVVVYRLHMLERIPTGNAQMTAKPPKTGPSKDAKGPKNDRETRQTRATNRTFSIDRDRDLSAHSRVKDDIRDATESSEDAGAGCVNPAVQAVIDDLARVLRPYRHPASTPATEADPADPGEGGAA